MRQPSQHLSLPPFGKELVVKLQSDPPPCPIFICLGRNAWQRARRWHNNPTVWALVLPDTSDPEAFRWPVMGLLLIVDWDRSASLERVLALAKVLLRQGAEQVTVWPRWVDFRQPAVVYDASLPVGQRWVQVREQIVSYRLSGNDDG